MMISNQKTESIKALGRIEGFKNDVYLLHQAIDRAPLWQPAAGLKKQCSEVLRMMGDLEQRFERKLIVTLIGPCGSGKSTLLNALAEVDDLSKTGHHRPTTRNLVVLSQTKNDADPLSEQLGRENVVFRSSCAAKTLEHVLLIDTPDTDSSEQETHIPVVQKAIALSDILICVFDSENPKRRDHIDFLASYVRLFAGDSLVVVINKCDRLDEGELREKIVPEFKTFIHAAWERPVQTVLCISARRNLSNPEWDLSVGPKHDFDQFKDLKQMIFGTFNRPGYVVDRRMENARSLRDYVFQETGAEVEKDAKGLEAAKTRIRSAEKKALADALFAIKDNHAGQFFGINVLLYQKLAQRWLGPVGWLIALWARILIFGTGMVAMLRFGNPIRQLTGMVSSLLHFKESRAAVAETGKSDGVDAAMRSYRMTILQEWPDLAEALVKSRFIPSVRHMKNALSHENTLDEDLTALWNLCLDNTLEKASKTLSGFIFQVVFNLPVMAILGHVGWTTARDYFAGHYLSSDFFLHAFLTIGIALFLSFFVFQGCVRLFAGSGRIVGKTFSEIKHQVEGLEPLSTTPVGEQIDAVLGLNFSNPAVQ